MIPNLKKSNEKQVKETPYTMKNQYKYAINLTPIVTKWAFS
jgi:hypothetical protein